MAPLTSELPKALLPTLDAPHLSWALATLARAGVRTVFVNAHDHHDLVAGVAAEQGLQRAMTVAVSHEVPAPFGTAGALRVLAGELTEPFVVVNADIATDLALQHLVEAHASARAPATVLAIPVAEGADFVLEQSWVVDLVDRREEVRSGHRYGGVAIFEPQVLEYVPPGESGLFETVMRGLVRDRKGLAALEWSGYWLDVGRPVDHLQANLDVLTGMRDQRAAAEAVGEACQRWDVMAFVAPEATVEDVELRHAVVGRRATIAPGSRLHRCVVWRDARLPRGDYRDTIVTPTRKLRLKERLRPASTPGPGGPPGPAGRRSPAP